MANAFIPYQPTPEDCWRGIVLYGRNVASYKFALAKALLERSPTGGELIRLEDLAVPYSRHICEHLKLADKQGTSARSRFLDACRSANAGKLSHEELVIQTIRFGFNNVIDAFHVVGSDLVPRRFFADERKTKGGIIITDDFLHLIEGSQSADLHLEAESRWRLVETAWDLGVSRAVVTVSHDTATDMLFAIDPTLRRRSVTSSRHALNGYQKGQCFYCFSQISLAPKSVPDVDHFFPHTLKSEVGSIVDGIWNLVLACRGCNRGVDGKSDRIPSLRLLERLSRRNEFLILSHHPLRETLMLQTGQSAAERRNFLNRFHQSAKKTLLHEWESGEEGEPAF